MGKGKGTLHGNRYALRLPNSARPSHAFDYPFPFLSLPCQVPFTPVSVQQTHDDAPAQTANLSFSLEERPEPERWLTSGGPRPALGPPDVPFLGPPPTSSQFSEPISV